MHTPWHTHCNTIMHFFLILTDASVCMCVCLCVCMCVYVYVCVSICMYASLCVFILATSPHNRVFGFIGAICGGVFKNPNVHNYLQSQSTSFQPSQGSPAHFTTALASDHLIKLTTAPAARVHYFPVTLPTRLTYLLWLMIAFFTCKSNLVPLLESLRSSNPCRFAFSDFFGFFAGIEPTTSEWTVPRSDRLS